MFLSLWHNTRVSQTDGQLDIHLCCVGMLSMCLCPCHIEVPLSVVLCYCCQLSDVAAAVTSRTRLLDAYNAAVANVNKAVDDADSSLHASSETVCQDLPALSSHLASLQVSCPVLYVNYHTMPGSEQRELHLSVRT